MTIEELYKFAKQYHRGIISLEEYNDACVKYAEDQLVEHVKTKYKDKG